MTASYIYHEYDKGDLLVVEDLHFTDYAYSESYNSDERFEVREKGRRLARLGSVDEVEEYLGVEIEPVVWYERIIKE